MVPDFLTSSDRSSPISFSARLMDAAPRSLRRSATTASRWARRAFSPSAFLRLTSASALALASAMIFWPWARASSRIWAASVRASASWELYFSSAALASSWAASARWMPPSICSSRSVRTRLKVGRTNFQNSTKMMMKQIRDQTRS